jgi:glutamate/tyrosine decarboxylase-like PLP-dependent enzyme
MHEPTPDDVAAAHGLLDWALARLGDRRGTMPPADPRVDLPPIGREGIGTRAALDTLLRTVLPTTVPPDHPRFLAFIPGTPTVAAALADMALSAAMVFGGNRLEGGAAVAAEAAVLRWLADAAGFPAGAGGTFVSGGSIASLSALVAARGDRWAAPRRQVVVTGHSAHSSVAAATRVLGCDLVVAEPADAHGCLDARVLRAALEGRDPDDVIAVVATAGATNNGAVDDLAGVAGVCSGLGVWLHVDAAYGGAALLSPRTRGLFAGIECADSLIVNPHKWLYLPFDCAAVLYRDERAACRSLTQQADYLDAVADEEAVSPSDLALHLTRRARGLPLWASVLANGTDAYVQAIDHCLDMAAHAALGIAASPALELVLEPRLTVVVFRRLGWTPADYHAWSDGALRRGLAMVTPTKHDGETVLRLCFINPLTTRDDVDLVLADLGRDQTPGRRRP